MVLDGVAAGRARRCRVRRGHGRRRRRTCRSAVRAGQRRRRAGTAAVLLPGRRPGPAARRRAVHAALGAVTDPAPLAAGHPGVPLARLLAMAYRHLVVGLHERAGGPRVAGRAAAVRLRAVGLPGPADYLGRGRRDARGQRSRPRRRSPTRWSSRTCCAGGRRPRMRGPSLSCSVPRAAAGCWCTVEEIYIELEEEWADDPGSARGSRQVRGSTGPASLSHGVRRLSCRRYVRSEPESVSRRSG